MTLTLFENWLVRPKKVMVESTATHFNCGLRLLIIAFVVIFQGCTLVKKINEVGKAAN